MCSFSLRVKIMRKKRHPSTIPNPGTIHPIDILPLSTCLYQKLEITIGDSQTFTSYAEFACTDVRRKSHTRPDTVQTSAIMIFKALPGRLILQNYVPK